MGLGLRIQREGSRGYPWKPCKGVSGSKERSSRPPKQFVRGILRDFHVCWGFNRAVGL